MHESLFELLELPDGRWCVARIATTNPGLVAGSFALDPTASDTTATEPAPPDATDVPADDPVGIFPTRDEAERAIDRATPAPTAPLAPFARWLSSP